MSSKPIQITTLAQIAGRNAWRLSLPHARAEHVLIWITRGQGRVLLGGKRRGIGTHNFIYIPARALFALDLGRQGLGQIALVPEDTPVPLPQIAHQLRLRDTAVISDISALFENTLREHTQARPWSGDAMQAHLSLISVWLRRQTALPENCPEKTSASVKLADQFCQSIATRAPSSRVIADYAKALGVTPTHLSRACKQATGRTAGELLAQRILHTAQSALSDTKTPIQDISRVLGFKSQAYFTRFIQNNTGLSPSKLRRAASQ